MSTQLGKGAGIAIVAGAVIVGSMFGSNIRSWFSSQNSAGGASSSSSYVSSEDEALTAKLQPFINCINNVDSPLRASAVKYRQAYDQAGGDPEKPNNQLHWVRFKIKPYEVDNQISKDCIKGLTGGVTMAPANASLDQAGKTFADTLGTLIPLMNAADTYYDQKNFKDDKFAKGKELDGQLSPLFDQLFTASSEMRANVEKLNNELHERELIAMEKADGKSYKWHLQNIMFQSRRAVDALDAAAESNKLTAETVQAIEQKLSAAHEDGKTFAAAHPDEKTRLGNKPQWFDTERYVGSLLAEIKTLRRDIAASKPQNDISADFQKVGEHFNDLVKDYNMRARVPE